MPNEKRYIDNVSKISVASFKNQTFQKRIMDFRMFRGIRYVKTSEGLYFLMGNELIFSLIRCLIKNVSNKHPQSNKIDGNVSSKGRLKPS